MNFARSSFYFLLLLSFVMISCRSTETTTVVSDPITFRPAPADETDKPVSDEPLSVSLGELQPIQSLDPLYALNNASKRAVFLIYEGLTRLDENGSPKPAIAESWSISEDSLTYTFTLRGNAIFHDSPVFSAGFGRPVEAQDVINVFNRMANASVPTYAAELFRHSIAGFDAFFQQNHSIYFIDQRPLSSISGIKAVDDNKVAFTLNYPDKNFLAALAHPYASIYPRESLRSNTRSLHGHPVGTGLFKMSSMSGDSLLTLERHFRHYMPKLADERVTSLNINVHKSESTLFRKLATEEIHALPELGPQTTETMLKTADTLMPNYEETYSLFNRGSQHFYLHFFPNSTHPLDESRLQEFKNILSETAFEGIYKMSNYESSVPFRNNIDNKKLIIGYNPHPFIFHASRVAVSDLMDTFDIKMYLANHPNIDLTFFWSEDSSIEGAERIKSFKHYNYALTHYKTGKVLFNEYPWWMSFKEYSSNDSLEL